MHELEAYRRYMHGRIIVYQYNRAHILDHQISPTSRFNISSIRICRSSIPSSRSLQFRSSSVRPVVPKSDCLASTSDALPMVPPLILAPLVLGSLRGNGTPPARVLPGAGDEGREGVGVMFGDAKANFFPIRSSRGARALRVLLRESSSRMGEGCTGGCVRARLDGCSGFGTWGGWDRVRL